MGLPNWQLDIQIWKVRWWLFVSSLVTIMTVICNLEL